MKKYFLLAALFLSCVVSAQSYINVGQFNIRYENRKDKEQGDGWDSRAQHLYDLVNYEGWDIFGVQEALYGQVNDLAANLDGYDYIGVGRQDGSTKGEFVPIFYRKSRIKCLDQGCFWLSETPEIPGSKGWDAKLARICTWGKFQDKSTKWTFWFFNLHLDHRGRVARQESAKLVLSKIREFCGSDPFIITGDFNSNQNTEVYAAFTKSGMMSDSYDLAKHRMVETGSLNLFNPQYKTDSRIDHIFVSSHFKVHTYGVLTHSYWRTSGTSEGELQYTRNFPSDHYPVVAKVELPLMRRHQDWARYGRYEEANKNVQTRPKAIFIGDSITDSWYSFHPEFFTRNNYLGRGISGQVTAQMLARFRADVINNKPKVVVILAGTNDIAMNQGYVSLDHICDNIFSMAELAKANKIKVVLCSILPSDGYRWSWEVDKETVISSIRYVNEKIEAYSKAHGHAYADYFSALDDGNRALKIEYQNKGNDPVHPNLEGYLVMEEVIQKILK